MANLIPAEDSEQDSLVLGFPPVHVLSEIFSLQFCFCAKSCKISQILPFQVISLVDEDFNNFKEMKNKFLQSSYKAVN